MAEINNRLKSLIILKFGTQADFAESMDVAEPTVSRVIRGRQLLSADELARWADALDCKISDFR